MLGILLVVLLATKASPKSITVVCEQGQDTPFCGQYNEESDGFYLTTDADDNGWRFRIGEISGEFCLQLRNGDQICGEEHVDELTRVRGGVRSILEGYIMEFHLWPSCDPKDYYCDNQTQDIPEKEPNSWGSPQGWPPTGPSSSGFQERPTSPGVMLHTLVLSSTAGAAEYQGDLL